MDEKIRFNLIDEPWIRVLDDAGTAKEVSLLELFHQAPKLKCLANDLPTQDFAILRVVLAILQRSISPMLDDLDEDMEPAEVWGQLWEASELPMDVIEVYLAKWHDRFDLFDPERPYRDRVLRHLQSDINEKYEGLKSSLDFSVYMQ